MSDKWYISGPLGIGETEPYAPLVVSGEISLKSPDSGIHSLRFKRTDEDNRVHEWALWHMNKDYRKNALEIWEYKTDSSGKNCDGNRADGAMCDFRLTISEGGNVGIGAASPVSKLHIHGNYLNDGTGGFALDATDNNSPETYILRINPFALGDSKVGYQFQTKSVVGGTNVPLTFDHVGNVGIGTTEPKARLQVTGGAIMPAAGDIDTSGILFPADPGGGGGDKAWIRYYPRSGESTTLEIGVANDPQDHIALMPSGNVGIGTKDPAAGKLQFDNNGGNKIVIYDNGPADRYGLGLNGGNLNAFVPAGGRFSIRQNGYDGTEVMAVTGTGDLTLKGNLFWSGDTSDSGYIILGTVQICWGNFPFPIPVHNNSTDVAFPHSFGKLPHVLISLNDPGAHPQEDREQSLTCGVGARGVTVSGFKAICKTSGNEDKRRIQCTWIAMGKA